MHIKEIDIVKSPYNFDHKDQEIAPNSSVGNNRSNYIKLNDTHQKSN